MILNMFDIYLDNYETHFSHQRKPPAREMIESHQRPLAVYLSVDLVMLN